MDLWLRRSLALLPIAVVVTCAALAASTVNHLFAASLADADAGAAPPSRAAAPRAVEKRASASKDAGAVIARNMFCSTCESTPAAPARPDEPAREPMTLALVATVRDGDAMCATLVDGAHAGAYCLGDTVAGIGAVRGVGEVWVDIELARGGRVERLHLGATATAKSEPRGIQKLGEQRFVIERDVVDKALADPMSARGGARFAPAVEDGRPVGFKVSGIRDSSLLGSMGIENGDQIRAVNGYALDTPDHVIEAYGKLREARQLKLAVLRGGARVDLEYSIR